VKCDSSTNSSISPPNPLRGAARFCATAVNATAPIVSRPDQGAVVAHPSTLADIERIRNGLSPMPSRIKRGSPGGKKRLPMAVLFYV
jgi:hypothetical protein